MNKYFLLALGAIQLVAAMESDRDLYRAILNRRSYVCLSTYKTRIQKLIDSGANPNYLQGQMSILEFAADMSDEAACIVLIEAGAQIDPHINKELSDKEWRGKTALMSAINNELNEASCLMIKKGANISLKDGSGRNALYYACSKGLIDVVKLLIERKDHINADVNISDECEGQTPLMVAMRANKDEICKLLIAHGADINAITQSSWKTPLICGAECKAIKACIPLMRHILFSSKKEALVLMYSLNHLRTSPIDCPTLLCRNSKTLLAPFLLYNIAFDHKESLLTHLNKETKGGYTAYSYCNLDLLNPEKIDETIQTFIATELQDCAP